jgi:hypothetical protein
MGNEWFYSRQGNRHGPLTAQQVKSLAASGDIGPSDLLWRPGLAAWARAERFKGLFAERPKQAAPSSELPADSVSVAPSANLLGTSPQEVNAGQDSAVETVPALNEASEQAEPTVASASQTEASATETAATETVEPIAEQEAIAPSDTVGTLQMAEADRTRLTTIVLPTAYRRLGQHLQSTGAYAAEFPDLHRHLSHLMNSLASSVNGNGNGHAPTEGKTVVVGHRIRRA